MRMPWLLALSIALLVPAADLSAWGEPGHRLVAALAEQQLRPATRAAALALLEGDDADHLADIAGWADRARDQPAYAWSKPLHYVNLADDCRYRPRRDCPDGDCVVGAIERFAAELADRTLPRARRAEALKWLVHFVGDLHQPLHAGFARDLGGNRYQLQLDGKGTNLHAVWDRSILAHRGIGLAEHLQRLATLPLPVAGSLDAAQWAEATCRIILEHSIYPDRRRIDATYLERQLPIAETQLVLAGTRLAALIERALGTPTTGQQ